MGSLINKQKYVTSEEFAKELEAIKGISKREAEKVIDLLKQRLL